MNLNSTLQYLYQQAKQNNFKGYDPYDGLNLDNALGNLIKKNQLTRLILIHLNKRSIFNFRSLLGIKPDINPKTLALFISGLIKQNKIEEAVNLFDNLKNIRSPKSKEYAWGYYFDWQSRVFFQPGETPTIVATSFVCNALLDLYEETNSSELLEMVSSSIKFFLNELNIHEDENGICFSYSPEDKSVIYNASALGLEIISRYQFITGEKVCDAKLLEKGLEFFKKKQNLDGSWYYGEKRIQHFIDNYHTAYLLESLENIDIFTNEEFNLKPIISKGLDFFRENMFSDYKPKYYKNSLYPIESHCSGAAIKALCTLSNRHGKSLINIALEIANWTYENLYDEKNRYFYYQKKKFWTNKVNYLRWSQAWMFAGLSFLNYYGTENDNNIN